MLVDNSNDNYKQYLETTLPTRKDNKRVSNILINNIAWFLQLNCCGVYKLVTIQGVIDKQERSILSNRQ